MSLPPLNPRDPAARAAARRRAQIAIRTARLRTFGTAGAITTLGVFTGLAAAHSPASPKPAAIAPPVADTAVPTASELTTPSNDGFVPDDQGGFDQSTAAGQAASDFFAQQSESQSQSSAAPAQSQSAAAPVQSQRSAPPVQRHRTVNPAPAPQYYVAPPLPAAPPAAMSSAS